MRTQQQGIAPPGFQQQQPLPALGPIGHFQRQLGIVQAGLQGPATSTALVPTGPQQQQIFLAAASAREVMIPAAAGQAMLNEFPGHLTRIRLAIANHGLPPVLDQLPARETLVHGGPMDEEEVGEYLGELEYQPLDWDREEPGQTIGGITDIDRPGRTAGHPLAEPLRRRAARIEAGLETEVGVEVVRRDTESSSLENPDKKM